MEREGSAELGEGPQPTAHTSQGLAIKKSRGSGKSDWKPVNTKTLVIVDY